MRGKILRVKYGYNPNSSSIGSETSGAVSNAINNASSNISEALPVLGDNLINNGDKIVQYAARSSLTYLQSFKIGLAIVASGLLIFFISNRLYSKIKSKNKKTREDE